MSDYQSIANKSWDDIPEPKLLPVGSWRLRCRGATYQPPKDADKSPQVIFVYTPKEPMEDVDGTELEKLGATYDVEANRVFSRFWVNDASDWDRVRKHVLKHGVVPEGAITETLKACRDRDVIAFLNQRSFQDAAGETREENVAENFAAVA